MQCDRSIDRHRESTAAVAVPLSCPVKERTESMGFLRGVSELIYEGFAVCGDQRSEKGLNSRYY